MARFLYSLPASLVGHRQPGAPPVPTAVADRYSLELQALAASLTTPGSDDPTVLTLDSQAGDLLLDLERDLEPRLAADSGDLAHLAGWAAKLAGATCRLAALLHLAGHLRDGWAQPISPDTLAGAIRLAANSGDLAHLAGWAAKLAGATCRLAGLLHLAGHLHDGWAHPIGAETFAGAARLAGYLVGHAERCST